MIRTAASAFVKGADEKSGTAGDFSIYGPLEKKLKDGEMSSMPLVGFRGNRFNIIFFNGGFVYFLHNQMKEFLKAKPDKNRLLRAVLKDLNLKSNIAGCKILGLISKQIMGPLWRVIENDDVHIVEMGGMMKEILDNLDKCVCDPEEFLRGNVVLCGKKEWVVKKDKVYECLKEPNEEIDDDCFAMLKVVLPSIAKLFRIHYDDLISMNKENDTEEKETSTSVVKHNKFAERVFAYTDHLLKVKPAISHIG